MSYRWVWRGVLVALALLVVWFLIQAANDPDDPEVGAPAPTSEATGPSTTGDGLAGGDRVPLDGFGEVPIALSSGSGETEGCALLADTADTRAQGLMGQRDLRGYDAMAFRFDELIEGTFTMRDTLIPLSIAFFDDEGAFVSSRDMTPCPEGTDDCPGYAAEGPYRYALEVGAGGLEGLGAVAGSTLSFPSGSCS